MWPPVLEQTSINLCRISAESSLSSARDSGLRSRGDFMESRRDTVCRFFLSLSGIAGKNEISDFEELCGKDSALRKSRRPLSHQLLGALSRLRHAEYGNVGDRKSTRLNSSHSQISYAVFCLKKKKKAYSIRCIARVV